MKMLALLSVFLAIPLFAQTATPPAPPAQAFSDTTITFNLTPITLPGNRQTLSGAETDAMIAFTPNNIFGETTLINSNFTFIGGRYNRIFPSVSTWLNNLSPNINGMQFQFGLTGSVGVLKGEPPTAGMITSNSHWGERVGGFVNYEINGTWGVGLEVQGNNFPGAEVPSLHNWQYSVAFGPSFHF